MFKKRYWRFTYCGGNGGLVIARSRKQAIEKLRKKYGTEADNAEVWEWENDDFCDSDNPDVFNIYDC